MKTSFRPNLKNSCPAINACGVVYGTFLAFIMAFCCWKSDIYDNLSLNILKASFLEIVLCSALKVVTLFRF